jgi:AcrR family transcriptional regulator
MFVRGVVDDRTAKAKIRDAAIAVVARDGQDAVTVRRVAETAGVSPGLVIHHFESMEGLERACDDYVAAVIRHIKQDAMAQGPGLDPLAALHQSGLSPLVGYLARRLTGGSDAVARLVDDLVDDAHSYMEQGVESGMLRPSPDPRGRAAVITLWSLGALVLNDHVRRLLGTDMTRLAGDGGAGFEGYARAAWDALGGVFTDAFAEKVRTSLTPTAEPDADDEVGLP